MELLPRLASIKQRFEQLNEEMARPDVATDLDKVRALAKERASLEEVVSHISEYEQHLKARDEAKALAQEGKDPEMADLARQEIESLNAAIAKDEEYLRQELIGKDPNDEKSVIVEVRAGAGGDEAGLFAADLFRMYTRYAQTKGWQAEVIDANETGIGGYKEIIFEVRGRGAYSRLKHESGVHRVQRVPTTEASGRIHTSTATVAVLPEADEVDVSINPDDLKIDIYHASGHGGQNVQKVATAVRITHLPTGIIAICQDERSQLKNKLKAMAVLRARLYDQERRKQEEAITSARRSQGGSGDRSEKVRTYNFPQDRLSDHRIGLTAHGLPRILQGNLDDIIDALVADEQAKKLAGSAA